MDKLGRSLLPGLSGTTACLMTLMVLMASVSAQPCTPSTCPEGPVVVEFAYANCTGPYSIYSFGSGPECMDGRGIEVSDFAVSSYETNNPQCDRTLTNSSYNGYIFPFGVCGQLFKKRDAKNDQNKQKINFFSALASVFDLSQMEAFRNTRSASDIPYEGIMVLPSVNSTIPSQPQPYFQYNPAIPSTESLGDTQECYSADNCTLANGGKPVYWETYYSNYGCTGSVYSYMSPGHNLDSSCYNDYNGTYIQYYCLDEHTVSYSYHYAGSCNSPANFYVVRRSVCSGNTDTTYHCLAPPPSNPTTEPSSANSSFIPSTLLVAFFCIIASLIAFS